MSAIQTIQNVCVSEQAIERVANDLNLKVQGNADEKNITFKSGSYGAVSFVKNDKGSYNVKYDSMYASDVNRLMDCVVHEEAVRQVELATGGLGHNAVTYDSYLNNRAQELEAVVSY